MRRLSKIVQEVEQNVPKCAGNTVRGWLAVHAAERHINDVYETAACLASLVRDGAAAQATAEWLEQEIFRHLYAIYDSLQQLRPSGTPRDKGWARESRRPVKKAGKAI